MHVNLKKLQLAFRFLVKYPLLATWLGQSRMGGSLDLFLLNYIWRIKSGEYCLFMIVLATTPPTAVFDEAIETLVASRRIANWIG